MLRAAIATIALVLAAACGNGTENEPRSGGGPENLPTVEDALQGPAAALGDGFSVPDDSWLAGDRFPDSRGWTAILVLGDDPLGVFGALLRQAQAAGFTTFTVLGSYVCTAETPRPEQRTTEYADLADAPATADRVHCAITAVRPSGDEPADTASFEMYLGLPDACASACTQSYARHLEISFVRSDTFADAYLSAGRTQPDPPDVGALALPRLPPPASQLRLPKVGERVGIDHPFFGGFEVEPDSEVLVPGTGLDTAGTGDYTVLLRIDGHASSVLEAYGRQFESLCCSGNTFRLAERNTNEGKLLGGGIGESGGLGFSVATTVIEDAEPTFMRVDVYND